MMNAFDTCATNSNNELAFFCNFKLKLNEIDFSEKVMRDREKMLLQDS
jgi:hypothetical protein